MLGAVDQSNKDDTDTDDNPAIKKHRSLGHYGNLSTELGNAKVVSPIVKPQSTLEACFGQGITGKLLTGNCCPRPLF